MTLNNHFALNTVFWVKTFSLDTPVLRHDCFKLIYILWLLYCQRQRCSPRSVVSGNIRLYADIRRGSLERGCQMKVRSSKMRVFCIDRNMFRMKFPAGFTYRNLHGFARFPGDSMALVLIPRMLLSRHSTSTMVIGNIANLPTKLKIVVFLLVTFFKCGLAFY